MITDTGHTFRYDNGCKRIFICTIDIVKCMAVYFHYIVRQHDFTNLNIVKHVFPYNIVIQFILITIYRICRIPATNRCLLHVYGQQFGHVTYKPYIHCIDRAVDDEFLHDVFPVAHLFGQLAHGVGFHFQYLAYGNFGDGFVCCGKPDVIHAFVFGARCACQHQKGGTYQ